jgi:glycosyltransferase involved in cell wall biosynthesis
LLLLGDAASFHLERYTAELRRQGCRVLVASLERGRLHHFHLSRHGPIRPLHYVFSIRQIRTLIRRFSPEVINAHYASGYGFTAALANRSYRLPLILNLWGSDILIAPGKSVLHRWKTAHALGAADAVFGDSDFLVSAAELLAPLKTKQVIPWGIEQRYLDYHKRNYDFNTPLKIIVPRIQEHVYNNLFIVRALAGLIVEGRVEVTFPGFGSVIDSFRKETEQLVGDRLRFYQKMPRAEFLEFMAGHDIYLSASKSDSSPASLIEAMALGLPPVAADIPGVREWLTPQSGFLFRQDDRGHLQSIITDLATGGDMHRPMREANLEMVKSRAIFEDNVAEQIRLMQSLVNRKSS